jgi:hypothetical protein
MFALKLPFYVTVKINQSYLSCFGKVEMSLTLSCEFWEHFSQRMLLSFPACHSGELCVSSLINEISANFLYIKQI